MLGKGIVNAEFTIFLKKGRFFMAITPISGSSPVNPVQTKMEPIKGVSNNSRTEGEMPAKNATAQENQNNNAKKPGVDEKKYDELKGVDKVDVKC
jgi:hypothetical protein